MTKIFRDKKYVNIIASGWMRAFFADYSFHPLNYILVDMLPPGWRESTKAGKRFYVFETDLTKSTHKKPIDSKRVVVGIDFGSARHLDRYTNHVTWGPDFNPFKVTRCSIPEGIARRAMGGQKEDQLESNYFKFLPKEKLFESESINMLQVLSEFDILEVLKPCFQSLAKEYGKVYGSQVIREFGKRFGSNEDVRAQIEADYFQTLAHRQESCRLMLAEIKLYNFITKTAGDTDPFDEFNTHPEVLEHLKNILTTDEDPLLKDAMTGKGTEHVTDWNQVKQLALHEYQRYLQAKFIPVDTRPHGGRAALRSQSKRRRDGSGGGLPPNKRQRTNSAAPMDTNS